MASTKIIFDVVTITTIKRNVDPLMKCELFIV